MVLINEVYSVIVGRKVVIYVIARNLVKVFSDYNEVEVEIIDKNFLDKVRMEVVENVEHFLNVQVVDCKIYVYFIVSVVIKPIIVIKDYNL